MQFSIDARMEDGDCPLDLPSGGAMWVTGSDGGRLHLQDAGHGEVCLLLHGFGEGKYVWKRLVERLSSRLRLISIDLRGHGLSDWDREGRYLAERHVADVQCVVDALSLTNFSVIGHSLGAHIAVHLHQANRDRLTRIALMDYSPDVPSETLGHVHAARGPYDSIEHYVEGLMDSRPLLSREDALIFAAEALKPIADGAYAPRTDPAIAKPGAADADRNPDQDWALLKAIDCPTLVLRGAASAVLSQKIASRMAAEMPACELRVVPAAGHALLADNPSRTIDYLEMFLLPPHAPATAEGALAVQG
jgi:pimeloyl-ACP methyl ester carboxylesterase